MLSNVQFLWLTRQQEACIYQQGGNTSHAPLIPVSFPGKQVTDTAFSQRRKSVQYTWGLRLMEADLSNGQERTTLLQMMAL